MPPARHERGGALATRPVPARGLRAAAAVVAAAALGLCATGAVAGFCNLAALRPAEQALSSLRAKGFADEPAGFSSPAAPDQANVFKVAGESEAPKKVPGGPPKPPAAPATYKALTKLRLRNAPSKFADLTSLEIPKDTVFRAVAAKEEEDGTMFLKATEDWSSGWIMMRGVAGKWAGKAVVKRVAGSMAAQKGTAVLEISEVDRIEVASDRDSREGAEDGASQDRPASVVKLLEDPQLLKMLEKQGVDVEELKRNPEFLEAVARKLFGDEVV